MSNNNNGFADAINQLNTVMRVSSEVPIDILEEAAEYFAIKLKPLIPKGTGSTHLRDQLEIIVKHDKVQLVFNEKGWYWSLVNKGHRKADGSGRVKGAHFLKKALDQHGDKTVEMMKTRIIERMGV